MELRRRHIYSLQHHAYFLQTHLQPFHFDWVHKLSSSFCGCPKDQRCLEFKLWVNKLMHYVNSQQFTAINCTDWPGNCWRRVRVHSPVVSVNKDFPLRPCLWVLESCLSISLCGYIFPSGPMQFFGSVMASPDRYCSLLALGFPWHRINPCVFERQRRKTKI